MKTSLEQIRLAMTVADLGAFISLDPPTNQYLTGFNGSTSAVLVSQEESLFLCDFRYTEQARRQVQGFEIHEVNGALASRLGDRLTELGLEEVAFDPLCFSVAQLDKVQAAYPAKLVRNSALVPCLRQRKRPDELDRIRKASYLAEQAMLDCVDKLQIGVSEAEFAAELEYEFKRRGAQGSSFPAIALFGARSSLPHGMPSEKALEEGDIVLIDCGCLREGYCSDLTRTFVFGRIPGAWFEEIYAVTLEAQRAALAAVRPGVPCVDLDAVARSHISKAGYGQYFGHGLGHGVGLEVHEGPRLNKESQDLLEPGMVITIEPGIYLPGKGGVRIEDLVVVTESGYELLSQSDKALKVLAS